MRDDVLLLPKLVGQLFCLQIRLWIAVALGEQLKGILKHWKKAAESSVGFGRREEGTQQAAKLTTALCSYENSYTFREDISVRFLNAINTDLEL